MIRSAAFVAVISTAAAAAPAADVATFYPCDNCAAWNQPRKPFKMVGNTYYVGTAGLSAVLVTSPQGHILLDGALPQSAPHIAANIAALGFRLRDVKYILNSHAHFDHAGGIPALARASGATVVASAAGAQVLESGNAGPDDPQYNAAFPVQVAPVKHVRVVGDGDRIALGPLVVTAVMTPGHTPGATSYTWQSCENGACHHVVYADSLNPVALDHFHFTGNAGRADISALFQASIDKLAALPCDVIVSVHPGFTGTFEKLAAATPGHNAFIAPGACKAYAGAAAERLRQRLALERAEKAGKK